MKNNLLLLILCVALFSACGSGSEGSATQNEIAISQDFSSIKVDIKESEAEACRASVRESGFSEIAFQNAKPQEKLQDAESLKFYNKSLAPVSWDDLFTNEVGYILLIPFNNTCPVGNKNVLADSILGEYNSYKTKMPGLRVYGVLTAQTHPSDTFAPQFNFDFPVDGFQGIFQERNQDLTMNSRVEALVAFYSLAGLEEEDARKEFLLLDSETNAFLNKINSSPAGAVLMNRQGLIKFNISDASPRKIRSFIQLARASN